MVNEDLDECVENALIRANNARDVGISISKSLASFVGYKTIKEAVIALKVSFAGIFTSQY